MCASKAQREEVLSELLAQYELELSGGTSPAPLDLSQVETDAELAVEFREAKHCLELLDRVRRRWTPADAGDTLGMLRSALATPLSGPARSVGRFELLHELGRGGLGVVYLARDPKLERRVALKVPRIEVLASEEMRERFLRESEAAARLSHPHVVAVHEAGEDGTICYIATEYCPGLSLAEWLKSHTKPVDFTTAARLVRQLASAVQHAHSRGVLHRDIKPSNVLLVAPADDAAAPAVASPDDLLTDTSQKLIPKLADFGMAKLLERSGDETRSGAMIGTPAYMSPEQAQGRVRDVDARSDVYGLGAVLYELLTGRRPFDGETDVEVLRNVLFEEVPAPRRLRPKIPRDLEAITQKCLAKQPEARYATAQELADDLQRFLSGRPTEARPVSTAARVAKWARHRPAVAALVAAMIASVAALFGIVVQYNARLQEEVVRADQARLEAEREASVSRQLLYAGDVRLAHDAYRAGNLPQMLAFLDQQAPRPGQQDIRNFAWHYLRGLGEKQVLTLRGHEGDVFSVAYSPDGRRLATASKDGTVRLWDAMTGRQLLPVLRGHTSEVTSVAWSPDGSLLASGSEDHSVRLWDAETGGALSVLEGHTDHVLAIAFSPDGKLLASGGRDLIVRVWDVGKRTLRDAIKPRQRTVSALAFSPDGSLLLAADEEGLVSCVDTRDLSAWMKGSRSKGSERLHALGFSHRTATVAAAGRSSSVDFWDWDATAGLTGRRSFEHAGLEKVQCLAYSPIEETLAFAARDGVTTLWSFNDPQQTEPQLLRTIVGHGGRVWSLSWSPDGRYLATASGDNTVKVWDTHYDDGRPPLPVSDTEQFAADISPDGGTMYLSGSEGQVHLVDLKSRRFRLKRQIFAAKSQVASLRCSPNGRTLAVALHRDVVSLVNSQTLEVERKLVWPGSQVSHLAWSPDGRLLLAGGGDSKVRVVDTTSGHVLKELAFMFPVFGVEFAPGGEQFALIASSASLFDSRTGRQLCELEEAGCLAFSPTEPILATSNAGVITYWDTRTYEKIRTLKPQSHRHVQMTFSHDGRVLATTDGEANVGLWDIRSGQELLALLEDRQVEPKILKLVFASDDSCLYGVGSELRSAEQRQARIWEWRAESHGHPGQKPSSEPYGEAAEQPTALSLNASNDQDSRPYLAEQVASAAESRPIDPSFRGSLSHPEGTGFGYCLATDEKVIVVGAQLDNSYSGRAYAYDASTGKLLHTFNNPSPIRNDKFGNAVAISGKRIVVGAYCDNLGGESSGVTYVYSVEDGMRLHLLKNPTPAAGDRFGGAVAIAGDRIVVGAFSDDTAAENAGAVYVFDAQTGTLLQTLLSPAPVKGDHFGGAVSISEDYLVVGARLADVGANNAGAAYVFRTATGEFLYELKHPAPAVNDFFGNAVAVSGEWIVVAADSADVGADDSGVVYVYSAATGTLHKTLNNPNPAVEACFGQSVAIAGEQVVVAGGMQDDDANSIGVAHVFRISDGTLLRTVTQGRPQHEAIGQSVAAASDFYALGIWGSPEVLLYRLPEELPLQSSDQSLPVHGEDAK